MRKRTTIIFTILFLLLSTTTACASGGVNANVIEENTVAMVSTIKEQEVTNVKIKINGVELKIPEEYGHPFIDTQNRTMIPLRIISESLGHKVEWDNKTQTANIDKSVFITVEKNIAYGPGSENNPSGIIEMDTKAILKDGRTYVPLRFVVEALGYEVKYDGPKASNGHNHMTNIFKEGMTNQPSTDDGAPSKDGNVYKIKGESGTVSINLDTDRNKYGEVNDEKAFELLELFHKSIKLTESKDSVKLTFYQPEMPTGDGLKYNASIELAMKEGSGYGAYLDIYSTNNLQNVFTTIRDDGYSEVIFEIDMSKVENIVFSGRVSYNGKTSEQYRADLRTGKVALGKYQFLYE
ncbi:copper amine oxidase N-terminal domain-containing protein [uncultured Tissierella sp.]|uniref:copper amine oxidase N-terminal domain-containing protein n=1 Tax=uncultured Tissierella sp. TaxID=448160 RepID=UPI0028039964|nr:copper amine oxidase N-terminal domain-containing protein [uncultured Tissierella sp.]MDU5082843.1 copper amine oxidase N-terminal domain-containing protein [Bacillota bacterium]